MMYNRGAKVISLRRGADDYQLGRDGGVGGVIPAYAGDCIAKEMPITGISFFSFFF